MNVFVTGTDTGVGKTVIATMLARGTGAHYWKPVQTGASEGTDADFARAWLGAERVLPETYRFDPPVSPHLAAEWAGATIDLQRCMTVFRSAPRPLVIEGAGGVLVPLGREASMIDLIVRLGVAAVVVASTRLGTINHTLLTLEALRARAVPVCGVIMNGTLEPEVTATIARHARVLGCVTPCESLDDAWFDASFSRLEIP